MKRRAEREMHVAACHHIILVTLLLCIYTLQAKPLVLHKPNEQSRKNNSLIATTSLLAVGTNSLMKMDNGVGLLSRRISFGA
jgi:hypothetical protein